MALIQCPDCNKFYSDVATACPHCGRPSSAELRNRYRDDSALVEKDARKGELAAIETLIEQVLEPIGATAKVTKTFGSLHLELSGKTKPIEEQACMELITKAMNAIKPEGTTVVGASFFHKERTKRWVRYLQLKDGDFVDNTKGTKVNVTIAAGIALVAFFGGCSAYINALQNPTPPTIEEKMKAIAKDKCMRYKIGCPEKNWKWSPELNRFIYSESE